MTICGTIAEYNPFHTGHAHHLAETRRLLGADTPIICAMSGSFVQRGDFALLDKYARAEAAVRCGADLIIELPLAAVLSSAEGFARGAAAVLHALGCDTVSFGAETPDTALIERAAAALDALPPPDPTHRHLSYAAQRQAALHRTDKEAAALLDQPNNTLAIEYCRAMRRYGMHPLAVRREGVPHDAAAPCGGFASASLLRRHLRAGDASLCARYMPAEALAVLQRARERGEAPIRLPDAVLLALLRAALYEGRLQAGAADGFDERLQKAVYQANSYQNAVERAKTRRFPAARVRRALLRTVLGIPSDAPVQPQYIRVLALGPKGRVLLRQARTELPVIVKPVSEKRLPAALQPALRRDVFADDLFALALPCPEKRTGGAHFRQTPYCARPDKD